MDGIPPKRGVALFARERALGGWAARGGGRVRYSESIGGIGATRPLAPPPTHRLTSPMSRRHIQDRQRHVNLC